MSSTGCFRISPGSSDRASAGPRHDATLASMRRSPGVIAGAGRRKEPRRIRDLDRPAYKTYQARPLQLSGRLVHLAARNAKHVAQVFLRQRITLTGHAVAHHEKPARHPLRGVVVAVAGSGFDELVG